MGIPVVRILCISSYVSRVVIHVVFIYVSCVIIHIVGWYTSGWYLCIVCLDTDGELGYVLLLFM